MWPLWLHILFNFAVVMLSTAWWQIPTLGALTLVVTVLVEKLKLHRLVQRPPLPLQPASTAFPARQR